MSAPAPQPDVHSPVAERPRDGAGEESKDLRAEHDALAARLAVRRSIDHFRTFAFLAFAAFIAAGMAGKLAWDRWGPPPPGFIRILPPGGPMFFLIALFVAAVLAAFAVRSYLRYARLAAEEAVLFEQFKALRAKLGLDA